MKKEYLTFQVYHKVKQFKHYIYNSLDEKRLNNEVFDYGF